MKTFRLLSYLFLCALVLTACGDDDEDEKLDIRPFPAEGITVTLGMDQLTVSDHNGYVYSHSFKNDYTLDYYLDGDIYFYTGQFSQEVLNEEYRAYFPKVGLQIGGGIMVGDKTYYNILKVSVALKKEYSKELEAIKEKISKNPLKIKITFDPA